jgi:hypothetical protein
MAHRSPQVVLELLQARPVVTLDDIEEALGGASRATAFRYMRQVPYRRSYNHNGRYYALFEPARYDRLGLYSHGDVHFSKDGTLGATVRRLVREAEAGHTHREVQELLRVRVQAFLLDAVRKGELGRERLAEVYVYLHADAEVRRQQLMRRQGLLDKAGGDASTPSEVSDNTVIQVLLTLVRHPGSTVAEVVRRLRGHSPPTGGAQVQAVFDRYGLGEKGGSRIS